MAVPQSKTTVAGYLAWEAQQSERHELVRGEVFAMVGARRVHGLVTGSLFAALKAHLKGTTCRAFADTMKVQVADDAVLYPDVFVTCHADDLRTDMVFAPPKLVIEVLSESTQAFDRGLKFALYRQLASLEEYALVDPVSRRVEVFRRNERGLFELHDQSADAAIRFVSVDCAIPMADVFDGVEEQAAP